MTLVNLQTQAYTIQYPYETIKTNTEMIIIQYTTVRINTNLIIKQYKTVDIPNQKLATKIKLFKAYPKSELTYTYL